MVERGEGPHTLTVLSSLAETRIWKCGDGREECLSCVTDLVVHGVPGHAVHSPQVAAQHCYGLVPLDVVDVDLWSDQ